MDVAIIGAGITGLTLAYELEKQLPADAKIYLFEKDDKIGGKIQSTESQGYLIEEGPDGFVRSKTALIELAKKLGIEKDLIQPAVNSFYIKKNGKLRTVPAGMGSMVPSDLFGFLTTNLLSTSGKVRMVRERLIPPKRNDEDESLASFFERRFGSEVLENLAEPLFTGVYATPAKSLSMQAILPQFQMMEQKYGSVSKAILKARKKNKTSGSVFMSFRNGMYQIVDTLKEKLERTKILTSFNVEHLRKEDEKWILGNQNFDCEVDHVILTAPINEIGSLLNKLNINSDLTSSVPFGSSQIISLGGSLKQDTQVRKATGYLIPYSEQKDISAITFSSWKWENRAPEGKALFRVFFNDKERSEEEMISLSLEELKQSCNISLDLELSHVTKWINKRPQYLVGHKQRMNDLSEHLTALGGISIAGASYTGIGVPDCIKIASETAYELSKSLKG